MISALFLMTYGRNWAIDVEFYYIGFESEYISVYRKREEVNLEPAQDHNSKLSSKSYWWALSFLRPYRRMIILLVIYGILAVAGEVLTPKVIQFVIDQVLPDKDKSLFLKLLGALVLVNILMLFAKNRRNILQRSIGELASRDLQTGIFHQLRKLGFAHYERHPVGETLSMFNSEVLSVLRIYRMYLPQIIDNLLFIIIAIVFLLGISGWLTLIFVPILAMYYLFGPYFERKATHYGRLSGAGRIQYNQKIYESISGLREFRAFGSQPWYHERTLSTHKNWANVYLKAATFGFARGSFRRFSFYIGAIMLVLIGYYFIKNNWITIGGFVAFNLLYMSAMYKLTVLVTLFTEQKLIIHQTYPLYQFMHKPILIEDPLHPVELGAVEGRLTFEDVCFGYPDRPLVIQHFSLNIMPGEKVAFVGTSGNGKTTLFKMIGRFYDPTSGVIKLDGVPIHELSLEKLRDSIGYVFQETYLFGSSVTENIRFGKPEATDEEVIEAAKAAYAHDFIMELPNGYDTLVGERGIKLSGGQKQRIAIARMFIKRPAIILLDEATSSLDNVSEWEVQRAFDEVLVGRTTIAIAHRLSTVKHFDKIVFVKDGMVAEMGTYEQLIANKGLLYELEHHSEAEERVVSA